MSNSDNNTTEKTDPNVDANLSATQNAKAIGGGLDAGSTDFGSGTLAAQGGRTGARGSSA